MIRRERDEAEWMRTVVVSMTIGVLTAVAVFAVLQARSSTRREFIPIPVESIVVTAPPAQGYSLGGGQSSAEAATYHQPAIDYVSRAGTRATAMPITQVPAAVPTQAPVDYTAKTRQIEDLKTQINALDEEVRVIRTNPKDNRYWWHYPGRSNGIDQQALDGYLKQLDKQRNDLRREKWALEGR